MSGTNRRTWQTQRSGYFLCTVQLDPPAEHPNIQCHDELAGVARRFIALMDTHRLPTTWAVSDPAHSAATALVLRSAVEHELAILGDSNWVGPTAGRTRFAREFTRRVMQARAAGLPVRSLVPRVATIEWHIDLIVKQHITAICGIVQPQTARDTAAPRAIHYGVWELPVTGKLPLECTWFSRRERSLWRRIRRAALEAGAFHLLIDAPAIAGEGQRAEKSVAWLIRRVAELRDRGLAEVQTLGAAASRLASVPAPKPQHSILRRAA
jgi:hypothetical protein